MTWIEALILGIVQGLTEFLPVSSSGHLEIGGVLLNIQSSDNLLFAVVVHAATALSTIVVFREDIRKLLFEIFQLQWNESHAFALKIIISMVPVGIIGVFFQDQIESFFSGNMVLVGSMLIVTAVLLAVSHYKSDGNKSVGYLSALVIGIAQTIAIMPGISRSGATISTALILGIDRTKAARFSFLMVLIPILGAAALKMKDYFDEPAITSSGISSPALIVGFLASFIAGYLACSWMIKIVRNGKLIYFGIYCFVVGLIAIVSSLL